MRGSRFTGVAAVWLVCVGALSACCPAPATAFDPATVLVGVVDASDGQRTWVEGDGGGRWEVRPPLTDPPGSVVYLRGRVEGRVFVRDDVSAVLDPP